jgi:hypothetical protein
MKPFLTAFLFLVTLGLLQAGDDKPTLAKVKWTLIGADQVRIEAEAESLVDRGLFQIPISPARNKHFLCRTSISLSDGTAHFELLKPSSPLGLSKVDGGNPLITLMDVERPFRNGEELVLLKSTKFTVLATISMQATIKASPAPSVEVEEPSSKSLSGEELKRIEIKTYYDPNNNRIHVTGYNPFDRQLGKGVLQVLIPKTETAPETFRQYRFSAQGNGLADFNAQISADLDIAPGIQPVCRLVSLDFAD